MKFILINSLLKKHRDAFFLLFFLHSECFPFCTVKSFCMSKWVLATPPIKLFIFKYQKLNFWASVVVQINNCCFQKILTESYFFHKLLQKILFLLLLDFSIFFKFSRFFVTAAPTDSMKKFRKAKDWDVGFNFFYYIVFNTVKFQNNQT